MLDYVVRFLAVLALVLPGIAFASGSSCTQIAYKSMKPPRYPPAAVKEHAEGKAIVLVTIGTDGVPIEAVLKTSSGNSDLDDAAVETAKSWRFEPKRCDGKAVISQALVPLDFSLSSLAAAEWDVVADGEPMEFDSISNADAYFRKNKIPEYPRFAYQRTFAARDGSRTWFIRRSPSGDLIDVIRWRQELRDGKRYGLYAFLCEGAKDVCASDLAAQVEYVRNDPMPAPPPPPLHK